MLLHHLVLNKTPDLLAARYLIGCFALAVFKVNLSVFEVANQLEHIKIVAQSRVVHIPIISTLSHDSGGQEEVKDHTPRKSHQ